MNKTVHFTLLGYVVLILLFFALADSEMAGKALIYILILILVALLVIHYKEVGHLLWTSH